MRRGALVSALTLLTLMIVFLATTTVPVNAIEYNTNTTIGRIISGDDLDEARSVVVDGNYIYVAGRTCNSTSHDYDAFVAKLDKTTGELVWAKTFGGSDDDEAYSITVDNNYIYVAGTTCSYGITGSNVEKGDAFVAKLDKNSGELVWFRTMGLNSTDYAMSIAVDNEHIYVAGIIMDPFNSSIFIAKLDKNGRLEEFKTTGESVEYEFNEAYGVVVDGNYIYVAGYKTNTTRCDYDAFVAKLYKSNFSLVWFETFGGDDLDEAYSIAVDNNYIYVAGWTRNSTSLDDDAFVAKLDKTTGELVWAKTFGSEYGDDEAHSITVDNNYIYVAGYIGGDAFIVKLDKSDGGLIWFKTFDSSGNEDAAWDVVVSNGNVYVVGYTKFKVTRMRDAFVLLKTVGLQVTNTRFSEFYPNRSVIQVTLESPKVVFSSPTPTMRSANFTLYSLTAHAQVIVAQSNLYKPTMTIFADGKMITITADSTGLVELGYGYVLKVSEGIVKAVVYSPVEIRGYSIKGNKLEINLTSKTTISIAAPKNSIEKIVVDYNNGTLKTICNSINECEALRDMDNVIVVDPATIVIQYAGPSSGGMKPASKSSTGGLGGELSSNPYYASAITMMTLTLITLALITIKKKNRII